MRLADLFTRKPKPDTTAQTLENALAAAKAGDYATALSIWEPLARAGNARAQNNIGACFAGGMGVEKISASRSWLALSAAAGDASGQRNLASLLFKGEDIEADYPEAARLYRLAAEQGDPQAQDMLSWMLMEGEVIIADPVEAREWALKAAEGGIAAAMTRLGMIYHNALGVPRDPSQAVHWWRKASAAGDPDGEAMLGAALHLGMGVERDPVAAYEYLLRAEAGGSALAAPFIEAARSALKEKP
ncbi:sel1 repeat family protein [Ochrobactrum oryzae]|nr:sel1 repeat family protein [Brucella oryzae]